MTGDGILICLSGPEKGRKISLAAGNRYTLGRGNSCDVKIADPRISRLHCTVEVSTEKLQVTDADSTGGTYVDGRRIKSQKLALGQTFQVGETSLRFVSKETLAAPKGKPTTKLSAKSLTDLTGQNLGDFKVGSLLHKGSSSFLFHAHDNVHDRRAVVKVMLPTLMASEEERKRFVRAVHTMVDVRHSNLVEVFGAGKQGPFCWCAMEYVDGISVREMIELIGTEGRLDWREVYHVAVHVARALDSAYRHNIVHRNVVPDNLLRTKNTKIVKLCDLMLAKGLEGTRAEQVTRPGEIVGDVAYMSPERIKDASAIDWRSDQYGLGATLFALLAGKPPFAAGNLPALVKEIREAQPQLPDAVLQEADSDFVKIVYKMLEKDCDDRFMFPSELLSVLEELGKEKGVDADQRYNF